MEIHHRVLRNKKKARITRSTRPISSAGLLIRWTHSWKHKTNAIYIFLIDRLCNIVWKILMIHQLSNQKERILSLLKFDKKIISTIVYHVSRCTSWLNIILGTTFHIAFLFCFGIPYILDVTLSQWNKRHQVFSSLLLAKTCGGKFKSKR